MEGFTLAGKLIPGWAIGMSLLATYLSSISFLANPGKSYGSDWRPFVFSLTLPIAIIDRDTLVYSVCTGTGKDDSL